MGLYGRRNIPGDRTPKEYINQKDVLNRTLRAQVTSVEPAQGYCILTFESLPGGGRYATVPPLWISFPPAASSNGPAWGRYMPQQTDIVKVAFDYDDRPQIVGFDIAASKETVGDGRAGWPQLNDQYNSAHGNADVPVERAKFAQFVPLNQGEYDFMSSGGAYIYGNNRGRLYLAGGAVSVTLVKNDLRISGRAQLWSHLADDCDFRFGQVRRVNPATQIDEKVAIDAGGTFKEFAAHVKTSVPSAAAIPLADLIVGNVVDDNGVLINSQSTSTPLRYHYSNKNDAGIENLAFNIDNLGNWEIMAPTAPSGVTFDFPLGSWNTTFTSVTHTATATYKISSPSILLGAAATNPLILSNTYRPAEDAFFAGIVSSIAALSSAVSALGTAIAAAAVPLAVPIVGGAIAAPIFAAAGVAVASASAAASATATAAQTGFSAGEASYLSTTVDTQ